MSWIVDNAFVLYVILSLIAVGLLLVWRNNRDTKYLGCAFGALALIATVWALTQLYVSDKQQLERNVRAMRDAVIKRKVDDVFVHVSKDFDYKGKDRDWMYARVKDLIGQLQVTEIGITSFDAEVSPEKRTAKTSFLVTAHPSREMFRTEADFVLEESRWKLKTLRFFMATGGPEIDVPGLR